MVTIADLARRKYACPVCGGSNDSLAEKKAHVKLKHGRKPKRAQ